MVGCVCRVLGAGSNFSFNFPAEALEGGRGGRWEKAVEKEGGKIKSDKLGVMSSELGAPSSLCCRPWGGRGAPAPLGWKR